MAGAEAEIPGDLYVRGKCRTVMVPMTVLRRLDAVLEPAKQPVLDMQA
jgi:type I restriction enzyme M protein